MADELKTKKITDLEENTTIDDTDILMAGDKGTNALKRFTVAKLFDAIKTKIAGWAFDTLTTTDKTLPGAVNELNSKIIKRTLKFENVTIPKNELYAFTINNHIDYPNGYGLISVNWHFGNDYLRCKYIPRGYDCVASNDSGYDAEVSCTAYCAFMRI